MARPRVFVSSTYYDLKHLRSSLENFVESLGFDAILSEKGKIAYTPDLPLDESCYREVGNTDIFVLIIGGRYGSEASGGGGKKGNPKTFFERYNSITAGEYRAALERNVPMYILIERTVYAEYETYLKNRDNQTVTYAHVDSVNIFRLIEEILAQPRNNPLQQFDKYADIEAWLREQWSGLFRELLQRTQSQTQLSSLQAEVSQLSELNKTLKTYLEEVVSRVAPKAESRVLIQSETRRLATAQTRAVVTANPLGRYLHKELGVPIAVIADAALATANAKDFFGQLTTGAWPKFEEQLSRLSEEATLPYVEKDLAALRLAFVDRADSPPIAKKSRKRSSTKATKSTKLRKIGS